ncbi:NAD(P)/FAD-dependent oxidoreductase [Rhodococcus sp. NPDC057014]|uniref:NAD(P)/FAD-dependent oxidoreductase n=1 Tax=Rhodococcus sp. NPDC057014 TaxID=3346000 RepID=UPI0036368601
MHQSHRHRVVIIGSGFGGLFSARALRRTNVDVTMIARTNHHLFQPLLYQVATGILSEGEIAAPTRLILRDQANTSVLLGDVTEIDLDHKTVISRHLGHTTTTPYDSLIVAAGAQQSYFGNDHFAEHAPGLKTVDDALELRGRILSAFDRAEHTADATERQRLLTFVVVGAGPTGVEMAGQIAELADRTLAGAYRNIDPRDARVILLDAAPKILPPFQDKLSASATARLIKMGVDIQLNAMVSEVDEHGLTVRDADGTTRRIEAACKIWSAGVAASPLGRQLAEQSGAGLDRAGRVQVESDLTLPGHPEVFVVGDMMSLDKLPGVAQVAIQGGRYAAKQIKTELCAAEKDAATSPREPFRYRDKGSMATVSRFSAVAQVGKLHITGVLAWVLWLAVHLIYIVGFNRRLATVLSWMWSMAGSDRGQLTSTQQQVEARTVIGRFGSARTEDDENEDEQLAS